MQPFMFVKSSSVLIIKHVLESNATHRVMRTARSIRLARQNKLGSIECIYIHDHFVNIEVVVALQSSGGWSEILVSTHSFTFLALSMPLNMATSAIQH